MMSPGADPRPLVVHLLHRFDTGGLENGVVNLINRLPEFRHAVVALTEITAFKERVQAPGTEFIALHKPSGHGLWQYARVWRLLRRLKPAVLHTRNLAALEFVVPAWAAGVPLRVHGEHGRDMHDLDGSSRRYQRVRRLYAPFVHRYIALSQELRHYLVERVGLRGTRIEQIYNGVDAERFRPRVAGETLPQGWPFDPARHWVVGAVGRMQPVKDPLTLLQAFAQLHASRPQARLVWVGDGPLRVAMEDEVRRLGLGDQVWLAGDRRDVPALLRAFDAYVLPSIAEGVSNTLLEAMASALPIVATRVGGNAELLESGRSGQLVPASDAVALAQALAALLDAPALAAAQGAAARQRVEQQFSLAAMVARYRSVYQQQGSRAA